MAQKLKRLLGFCFLPHSVPCCLHCMFLAGFLLQGLFLVTFSLTLHPTHSGSSVQTSSSSTERPSSVPFTPALRSFVCTPKCSSSEGSILRSCGILTMPWSRCPSPGHLPHPRSLASPWAPGHRLEPPAFSIQTFQNPFLCNLSPEPKHSMKYSDHFA